MPGTIADQLGFDSFDALLSSPNDRPVLLLVDNCEHLLDAVAAAVVQVLGRVQPADRHRHQPLSARGAGRVDRLARAVGCSDG